jgi:hypothetical protein
MSISIFTNIHLLLEFVSEYILDLAYGDRDYGSQSSSRPCRHEWRHVGSTARRYQHGGLTEYEHGNYA